MKKRDKALPASALETVTGRRRKQKTEEPAGTIPAQFLLTEAQHKELGHLAVEMKRSRSDLMREAIEDLIQKYKR